MLPPSLSAAAVGLGALRENPLRTLLSTLGVIIGVAALVAVLSLGDAMQAFVRSEIDRVTDVQSVTIEPRTFRLIDGSWEPVRNPLVLTLADLSSLKRETPSAQAAVMSRGGSARVSWPGSGKQRKATIAAVTEDIAITDRRPLADGRSFTPREALANAPVVVLSWRLAEELADGRPATSLIGQEVRVGPLPRVVIGVFAARQGERGYSARIPYAGAAATLGNSAVAGAPSIALKARSVDAVATLTSEIEDWLALRFQRWEDRIEIIVAEAELAEIARAFLIMKLFLGLLAGISMLVGGIGIMNIMLASVTERTREIGIRKAIGANVRDIRVQFLTEAVAISAVGSGLGVVLGLSIAALAVGVMHLMVDAEGLQVVISPWTLVMSATLAVIIGLVFGTYPARRASHLSPIDAIRHE
ncbi:ABC transporter permease [Gemmatimonas phototrophica]|uniref:ABC transporter permease n=1 Tax=Gemmatimonas phototrophica TaxID=1379270 RepID=UPI0009462EEE|nr:ABC transporter permease [Gemmatimonas phototrophica]